MFTAQTCVKFGNVSSDELMRLVALRKHGKRQCVCKTVDDYKIDIFLYACALFQYIHFYYYCYYGIFLMEKNGI